MRRLGQNGKMLVALLGLFLATFMTLEAAHSHPANSSDISAAAHCQLCATPHTPIAGQPDWLTAYVLDLIGEVSIGEPSPISRLEVFVSLIRPPPAGPDLV